jgi:YHS domain-containing protein
MKKMKKIIFIALSILFVFVSFLTAEEMMHQHKGHSQGMEIKDMSHMGCLLCDLNADFSVKETKDGVVLTIKAKKDGDDAKKIQESVKKWLEMRKNMAMAGDDEIVVCPVMGTKMKKKDAYDKMEYKGKKYYLCCKKCVDEFKKNPEKYIKE